MDQAVPGLVVGDRAFFQTDDHRGLGPALRWAIAQGAKSLDLVVDGVAAGDLARRCRHLDLDQIGLEATVWSADGPTVVRAEPTPVPRPPDLAEDHQALSSLIAEAGALPVDDHGRLVAEVAGLEVARVVDDPDGRGARLSLGVGQADRELQVYLHGHLDDDANLRRVIAEVVRHRRPASAAHPLSRLARQRWLRSSLIDAPAQIGFSALTAVPPLRARSSLIGSEPAAAHGPEGMVVCSVGVDLDLVPEAADYRHRDDPEAELVIVVPERDRLLSTSVLAPAVPGLRIETIPLPWVSAQD